VATEERTANVVLTADNSQYSRMMTESATSTNKVTDSVTKLLDKLDKLHKGTTRKLEIITAAQVAAITAATVAAGRFEQQLSTLQATSVTTGRNFMPIHRSVDQLRRDLPVTTESVVALAGALQRLGANPANLERTAQVLVKLSASTGEDLGQLATGMINLQRSMGTTEASLSKFADSLVSVSANMGVSATGVLSFAQSLAPVARTVGMVQTDVLGFSAAFQKAGQDGFTAANTFTQMLTDTSRATRYGSTDLAMYANLVGQTTESFKGMGSTQQLTAIFESINKLGPDAVKTLERMGFDGPRAMRAIQGVAQSGDLQKALAEASGGYGSGANEKASKAAMDGLNDSMLQLRNTLTSTAQEFGRSFLPMATAVVDGFNAMAGAARALASPVASVMAALGAAGTGALGGMLSALPLLATVAGGVMLTKSAFGAGFAGRRAQNQGRELGGILGRSAASFDAGEGTPGQQRMYRAGQSVGGFIGSPWGLTDRAVGAAKNANIPGRVAMAGGAAVSSVMNFLRSNISPLEEGRWQDASKRSTGDWERSKADWRAVRTGTVGEGDDQRPVRFRDALTTAAASTGRFTASLASATVGLARLTATTAASAMGGVGAMAGRGLRNAGAGLMGLAGGPWGLALMGGLGAYAIGANANQRGQDFQNKITGIGAEESQYNRYATNLGLAGAAALSFAGRLKQAETSITTATREDASTVRPVDIQAATVTGRKLTDPTLTGLSRDQAATYSAPTLSNPNADNAIRQALKLDLIQQYGEDGAQQILNQAGSGTFNPGQMLQGYRGDLSFWDKVKTDFGSPDELEKRLSTTVSSAGVMRANAMQFGTREADKVTAATVNSLLSQYGVNEKTGESKMSAPEEQRVAASLESVLGMQPGQLDITAGDQGRLNRATGRERTDVFRGIVGESGNGAAFERMMKQLGDSGYASTYQLPSAASLAESPLLAAQRATVAGAQVYGGGSLGNTIQGALQNEANQNAQLSAAQTWAQELTKLTGSTTQAGAELQDLKAAIGDPNDALYQLAAAAQNAAERLQGYDMQYMSTGERSGTLRGNLESAVRSPENAPDREERIMGAMDAYEQQRGAVFNQLKSINRAFEEFDISQQRAVEDFGISRARQDQDYYTSLARSNEDFNLQRQRSDQDYYLNRSRSDEDFWRQTSRSNEDFNLQRRRGEIDFNISRSQATADFNKSRRRSESDFNRQIVLMASQTAKQMADIYTRVPVKPSWDAQNLLTNARDQNSMFNQQNQNLDKLRDMGVSSDVIKQLGLNEADNAQQLARFVADLAADPSLVKEWNKTIKGRLSIADALMTDEDNTAFTEMRRQFNLTADRAEQDFKTSMKRSREAYERSYDRMTDDYEKMMDRQRTDYKRMMNRQNTDYATMMERQGDDYGKTLERNSDDYAKAVSRTVDDWNKQMARAQKDLNRSFKETTGTFEELSEKALSRMSGTARAQMRAILGAVKTSSKDVRKEVENAIEKLDDAYVTILGVSVKKIKDKQGNTIGLDYGPNMSSAGGPTQQLPGTPGSQSVDVLNPTHGAHGGPEEGDKRFKPVMGGAVLTSGFGMRKNPVTGQFKLHAGQDFAAPTGRGIAAAQTGRVTFAGWDAGGGNMMRINHGGGFDTWYLHMSRMMAKTGQSVAGGQKIGEVGSTGNSTGPHLHFETRFGGVPRDPKYWLSGAAGGGYSSAAGGGGTDDPRADASKAGSSISKIMRPVEEAQLGVPGLMKYMPPGMITMLTMQKMLDVGNDSGVTWHGNGGIFTGPKKIGVGERGGEMVLPLNHQGADFIAGLLQRFTQGTQRANGSQVISTPTVTNYAQHVDSSINFTGEVHVKSNDPNDMARKLEEKARLKRLVQR
jgi:TP901 family phage tail tape measure protein